MSVVANLFCRTLSVLIFLTDWSPLLGIEKKGLQIDFH